MIASLFVVSLIDRKRVHPKASSSGSGKGSGHNSGRNNAKKAKITNSDAEVLPEDDTVTMMSEVITHQGESSRSASTRRSGQSNILFILGAICEAVCFILEKHNISLTSHCYVWLLLDDYFIVRCSISHFSSLGSSLNKCASSKVHHGR